MTPYRNSGGCNSRMCVCVRVCIHKGLLLCSGCMMHRLWLYVEHGAGSLQVSAKAGAQRKQGEKDVAQVREYSGSCGLSFSLSALL